MRGKWVSVARALLRPTCELIEIAQHGSYRLSAGPRGLPAEHASEPLPCT